MTVYRHDSELPSWARHTISVNHIQTCWRYFKKQHLKTITVHTECGPIHVSKEILSNKSDTNTNWFLIDDQEDAICRIRGQQVEIYHLRDFDALFKDREFCKFILTLNSVPTIALLVQKNFSAVEMTHSTVNRWTNDSRPRMKSRSMRSANLKGRAYKRSQKLHENRLDNI